MILWITLYISRYTLIYANDNKLLINKPFNILFKKKSIESKDMSCVEFVSFKGPLFKITMNDNISFSFSYASQ
jgi:hypothetical protein